MTLKIPSVMSPLVCDPFLPLSPLVRCRKGGIIHLFSVLDHMETRRAVVLDILYGIQTSSLPEETAKRFKKDSTPRLIQNKGASPTSGLIQLTALMVEMKTCHVLKVEKG